MTLHFGLRCEIVSLCNFRGSEFRSVSRSGSYPPLSNFLIIFLSCWLVACVGVQVWVCVSLSVCLWNREHVRLRCCCSRLSCYLQLRVYRPPQAGWGYPTLTCLIVCLSQRPPVSVSVFPLRWGGQGRQHPHTHTSMHARKLHMRGKSIKTWTKPHSVSVRYCQAHVVSVCPIKMCLYQGASLKSVCCFECAETSANIPPTDLVTAASH